MGPADALRIVHARVFVGGVLAELRRAPFAKIFHVILRTEVQAARRASLYTGRFQPGAHAIGAQGALKDLLRRWIKFRNVEWASGNAVLAPNAIVLVEIDDAVLILHDGPIRRACRQASGIRAVHALVFTHQPAEGAVVGGVLVKANQVPVIPRRIGHGLVGVIESSWMEGISVPLQACHLTRLAPD